MVAQKIIIKNPTGLHLRPAGNLCKEAMKFKSKVTFIYDEKNVANAKSVLSVDASEALEYLIQYIKDGLGE